jgi:hypothetical protein
MLASENHLWRRSPKAIASKNHRITEAGISINLFSEVGILRYLSLKITISRGGRSKRPSLKLIFIGERLKMSVSINSYI